MRHLLRDAEQVLETAACAGGADSQSTAICMTAAGAIRMVDSPSGWAIPALAAHYGADSVYLVERHAGRVRVEAWSRGESCVLVRELPGNPSRHQAYAGVREFAEASLPMTAELVPARHRVSDAVGAHYLSFHEQFQLAN